MPREWGARRGHEVVPNWDLILVAVWGVLVLMGAVAAAVGVAVIQFLGRW